MFVICNLMLMMSRHLFAYTYLTSLLNDPNFPLFVLIEYTNNNQNNTMDVNCVLNIALKFFYPDICYFKLPSSISIWCLNRMFSR